MPASVTPSEISLGKQSFVVASLSDPRLVALERFEYNISQGNWAEVQLALENGADPNQITQEGMPVIMLAVTKKHRHIVAMLLDYDAKIDCSYNQLSLCMQAMVSKCPEILELLLSRGANPNQKHNGIPLLLLAIKMGEAGNVQLLLKYGALIPTAAWSSKVSLIQCLSVLFRVDA
jgi:ankyrin repeat protein